MEAGISATTKSELTIYTVPVVTVGIVLLHPMEVCWWNILIINKKRNKRNRKKIEKKKRKENLITWVKTIGTTTKLLVSSVSKKWLSGSVIETI